MKKLIIENEQEPFETDKEYKKRIKKEGEYLTVYEDAHGFTGVSTIKKIKKVI
jgi:hypothetical protein